MEMTCDESAANKATVYLQMDNFLQISIFGLSNDPNEISNVKKKSLKKIKYWQKNGGFKFWPEVEITHIILPICNMGTA